MIIATQVCQYLENASLYEIMIYISKEHPSEPI